MSRNVKFWIERGIRCFLIAPLIAFSQQSEDQIKDASSVEICPPFSCPVWSQKDRHPSFYLEASYLYWHASQEGLDLASTQDFQTATNVVFFPVNPGKVIFQDAKYTSGFQVAAGYIWIPDGWEIGIQYTYLRPTTSTSKTADNAFLASSWFVQVSAQQQGVAATALSSRWHLDLDWLDAMISYPVHLSRKWVAQPHFGMRAARIDQSLRIDMNQTLNISPAGNRVLSHNTSDSWGLGPRALCEARWLAMEGLYFGGNFGASLLFTRYTSVRHSEEPFVNGGRGVSYRYSNYDCLRPMMEAALGLGWGGDLRQKGPRLDVRAFYEWNFLWSQNMMRQMNDSWDASIGAAAQALSLHGLTVTARCDF